MDYCSIATLTSYHNHSSGRNNTLVLAHSSTDQKSGHSQNPVFWVSESHKLKSTWQPDRVLVWRFWGQIHFQAHFCHWQNSVLCSYRTEVPVSLLAFSWRLLSILGGHPYALPHGHLHLQATNGMSVPGNTRGEYTRKEGLSDTLLDGILPTT